MLGKWSGSVAGASLCFVLGYCRLARAQEPPAEPAAAQATRPIARSDLTVAYPEGASGSAEVVLELTIDRAGTVADARAVSGDEPFASAAVLASASWLFEPARRGDETVPAKIRVAVRFEPPAPLAEEPPAPAAPSPSAPSAPGSASATSTPAQRAPPAQPTVEFLVTGQREPARMSLGRAEVRELPGTFGDPFRAIEVMPGVTPIITGVPFFFVRGAPPGNVGYFLDGVRVPLLFHVALGPSVIHPGLVDRVDLYSGGYPASLGRFAGGVVSAETTAPRHELHGEGNVRIFDAGALVEGPWADQRGTALVAGRYSYTAAILSLIAPQVTLSYWDYQARVTYALSRELELSVFAFGAYDLFEAASTSTSTSSTSEGTTSRTSSNQDGVGSQFHRADLRLDYRPDPRTQVRVALTLGLDRSGSSSSGVSSNTGVVDDRMLGVRASWERRASDRVTLRAGADVVLDAYRVTSNDVSQDFTNVLYSRNDTAFGARGDLVWRPTRDVTLTPGLRADVYASGSDFVPALDPRVSAVFDLSKRVSIEQAFGLAHQAPSFLVPIPGIQLSDLKGGLQSSLQHSAGVVARPGDGWEARATLFQSAFFKLTDLLGNSSVQSSVNASAKLEDRALGHAYGLELSLRRPLTRRLGGFLSYTLSRSERSIGRAHGPATFDRTHVLHAALAYDLGLHWRAGTRFTGYSGVPAQRRFTFSDSFGMSQLLAPSKPLPRSPGFYRLDLRLEKRWPVGTHGAYWAFVLELLNATLNKEIINYRCDVRSSCTSDAIGPVTIPSIGVEAFF